MTTTRGIVAWLFDGEVAVDVQGLLGITIGYRITPARARRLAAELIEYGAMMRLLEIAGEGAGG